MSSYIYWRLTQSKQHARGYVETSDGAKIYYEIHGTGTPVILLHGGLAMIEAWYCQLPTLTSTHRVIAIDLRGHGRSSLGTTTLSYLLMAENVTRVMYHLNVPLAAVVGWSDGGIVGLVLAVKHQHLISRLVAISADIHPSRLHQNVLDNLETQTAESHNFWVRLLYRWRSPQPWRWNELWRQVTQMWKTPPPLTPAGLALIKARTILLVGENDDITPEHTRLMQRAIPNATSVVIPGVGHDLIRAAPRQVNNIIVQFLNGTMDNS